MSATKTFAEAVLDRFDTRLCDLEEFDSLIDPTILKFDHTVVLDDVLQHLATACIVRYEDGVPTEHFHATDAGSSDCPFIKHFHDHHAFFNSCDLVSCVVRLLAQEKSTDASFAQMYQRSIGQLANSAKKYSYTCITADSPCSLLFKLLQTVYYIPILSEKDPHTLIGVCTVPKFLKFIQSMNNGSLLNPAHVSLLDLFTARDIKGLVNEANKVSNLSRPSLITCFEDASTCKVLSQIDEHHISAVPIVNHIDRSQCISVFSVTDLRLFLIYFKEALEKPNAAHLFQLPVLDVLSKVYQLHSLKAKHPMIHCKMSTPINVLLNKMLAVNIRHLLLADASDRVISVLTPRDILKFLADNFLRLWEARTL